MSESFFQSIEFANLLDVMVLLVVLLLAPLFWSALPGLTRRQKALFLLGYGFILTALFSATYQTAHLLFGQFPHSPALARYVEVFAEALSFWLFCSFFIDWLGGKSFRAFFWTAGIVTVLFGASAGFGGWPRTALVQSSFRFRPEAELLFGALKVSMTAFVFGWLLVRGVEGRFRYLPIGGFLVLLREAALLVRHAELPPAIDVAAQLYTHLGLAAGGVFATLAMADFDLVRVRTRAFRVLIVGFVALSTSGVALSFNYLLRDRLLDEALWRFRGEARKIANDINAYLKRIEEQVRALAVPELYATLAHPADSVRVLATLPREFWFADFASVGFFTAGGEVLRIYGGTDAAGSLGVLDVEGRAALFADAGGLVSRERHFASHGSLFYEIDGQLRIRRDRHDVQPELFYAAAVRDGAGRPIGYVEALLPTRKLQRFFSGYGTESGWDFVATREGLVLSHGSPDYAGYDLSWFPEIFSAPSEGERWRRIALPGGASYVVLGDVPGRDWVVARVLSTQAILGALKKLRGETLTIVIVTLAVTTLVALLLSGFVSRQRVALERMTLELEHKQEIEAKNVELSLERQKIETILLSLGEGVIVCDADENVVFVNRIAESLLGVAPGEIIGQPVARLRIVQLEQALSRVREALGQPQTEPIIEEFVGVLQGTDVRASLAPIVREGERFQGTVIVIQDISEMMKVDRMKTEILSIVSHSLRTPLTSIKSYTEILQSKAGKLDLKKEREYLDVIDLSTDRLTRIVNNILDLSKIAGGKMQYSFRPTALEELLEESVTVASGAAEAKKIVLGTHWNGTAGSGSEEEIKVDRAKMMQVFDNLLGNAIKFTPHGGKVDVYLRRVQGREIIAEFAREGIQPEGEYALIEVHDTGVGISEQNLDRIFDRFFQDDYVRQSNEGGTGLGLAISKEYVLAHGGQIWARSRRHEGSRFFITLPV